MQNDSKEKMMNFVKRLTANPCFSNETALEIEENILVFYKQNYRALIGTFSTASFFPGVSTDKVESLFVSCLQEITDEKLNKEFEKISSSLISFKFFNELYKKEFNTGSFQKLLLLFLQEISKRIEVRRTLSPIIKILNNKLINNYIDECFLKRSYIAFELEKVEKVRLNSNSIADYIKLILLFSILGHVRNDISITMINSMDYQPGDLKFPNSAVREKYFQNLSRQFSSTLSNFPPEIIQAATMTHVSALDDPLLPASSRISRIFYSLGKTYKPGMKIDKGAETFAKSWFQTQRRNYKYYGFDIKMLDEFYRISAENNW